MMKRVLIGALAVAVLATPGAALANDATPADHFAVTFSSTSVPPFMSFASGALTLSSLATGAPVTGRGSLTVGDVDTGTVYSGTYTATQINGIYDFDASRAGGGSLHSLVARPDSYGVAVTLTPSSDLQRQDLWIYCGNARTALDIGITLDSPLSKASAGLVQHGGRLYAMPISTGTVSTMNSFC